MLLEGDQCQKLIVKCSSGGQGGEKGSKYNLQVTHALRFCRQVERERERERNCVSGESIWQVAGR